MVSCAWADVALHLSAVARLAAATSRSARALAQRIQVRKKTPLRRECASGELKKVASCRVTTRRARARAGTCSEGSRSLGMTAAGEGRESALLPEEAAATKRHEGRGDEYVWPGATACRAGMSCLFATTSTSSPFCSRPESRPEMKRATPPWLGGIDVASNSTRGVVFTAFLLFFIVGLLLRDMQRYDDRSQEEGANSEKGKGKDHTARRRP